MRHQPNDLANVLHRSVEVAVLTCCSPEFGEGRVLAGFGRSHTQNATLLIYCRIQRTRTGKMGVREKLPMLEFFALNSLE